MELKRVEFCEECSKFLGCQKHIQGINPRTSQDLRKSIIGMYMHVIHVPAWMHKM